MTLSVFRAACLASVSHFALTASNAHYDRENALEKLKSLVAEDAA